MTVSLLAPAQNKALVASLAERGVTALALDCIPRTLSRAQAFDVLSSQANIAGYRAVVRTQRERGACCLTVAAADDRDACRGQPVLERDVRLRP